MLQVENTPKSSTTSQNSTINRGQSVPPCVPVKDISHSNHYKKKDQNDKQKAESRGQDLSGIGKALALLPSCAKKITCHIT